MDKGYQRMEKIRIGIICYDLQEFTTDFINRLVDKLDENKYQVKAYPMVDNVVTSIDIKFQYTRGKSLKSFKVYKSGNENTTHEAMLLNPNYKQAFLSVKESDIILHYGLHATTALIISLLSKVFRVKQISTNVMLPAKYETKRSRKILFLKKFLLNSCNAHVAQTPTSIDTLKEVFGIKKNIYYAPFDCGISYLKDNYIDNKNKVQNEKVEFIFVGNIIELKGIYILFEAVEKLIHKGVKDFHITMIGPESIDINEKRISVLVEILTRLGIVEFFTFTGRVKYNELEKYFEKADICILPSLRDTWPKVIFEAALVGLPSLISDACGQANSFIYDSLNGYICESNNSDSLKNKIEQVILNKSNLKVMGINAKKSLNDFINPKKEIKAYEDAIKFVNEN